jgi:hypothetical protein
MSADVASLLIDANPRARRVMAAFQPIVGMARTARLPESSKLGHRPDTVRRCRPVNQLANHGCYRHLRTVRDRTVRDRTDKD